MKIFSERIKELRTEKGLTQREIAKKLGISHISYFRYEQNGEPKLDMLVKIAKFFNVTVGYLVGTENY